jgi:hypothetical protein
MAIRGSCLCGAVTFEIDRAAGPAEFCHCNRCRKVSGSASLLSIYVSRNDYRFLSGRELVKTYDAPILYRPPAYRSLFCGNCGSPVPDPEPQHEVLEIPAGLLDDDPGIRPDRHICVEFAPPWDRIDDGLPTYTLPEIHRLRGRDVPEDFQVRWHGSSRPPVK